MLKAPILADEDSRLAALKRYHLLDTLPEAEFDRFTHLAALICGTPISLVSLVDADRQWFKSDYGLGAPQTPRDISFCGHAIHGNELFEVSNTLEDPRFVDNPLVTSAPDIRFYAGMPLITPDGHGVGTLCVIDRVPHQLTKDQKEALKELGRLVVQQMEMRISKDQALAASEAKSEFLSRMSHELRTPMNAILGFAQLIQMGDKLDPSDRQSLDEILHSGHHLLNLINEVLDLSRVEAGHLQLSLEPVGVESVIAECLALMTPVAHAQGITLVAPHYPDNPPCNLIAVQADRFRLKQVLMNLISNAIKYNRTRGSVCVHVRPEASPASGLRAPASWSIEVVDEGAGFAPTYAQTMFEPFSRMGYENSTVEGTGIGLAICKKLVEAMHGELRVSSRMSAQGGQAKGSTMAVVLAATELPRDVRQSQASLSSAGAAASAKGNGAPQRTVRLLCVEDNPANLRLIQQLAAQRRHWVLETASSPEIGLELALANPPDALLLDINLPGMSGYELLKRLRANPATAGVPALAFSANAMEDDIARGLAAGFTHYLTKPLDIDAFYKALDSTFSNIA